MTGTAVPLTDTIRARHNANSLGVARDRNVSADIDDSSAATKTDTWFSRLIVGALTLELGQWA